MSKLNLDFIRFIRNPYIEDYTWEGDTLLIWVNNYKYSVFVGKFKKICRMDKGGLKARLGYDCVGINLAGTDLLEKHGDELRAVFPPEE